MWSACAWVNAIAWTVRTRSRSNWIRISGVVSTSRFPRGREITTLGRVRQFRGSPERQTGQSQPSRGTPLEVPLPRKVNRHGAADVVALSNKLRTLPNLCLVSVSGGVVPVHDCTTPGRPRRRQVGDVG